MKQFRVFHNTSGHIVRSNLCVLAPEHELVKEITTPEQKEQVEAYIEQVQTKSDLERTDLAKEKTGVFTGAYAINPVNGKKIPIWIADYVLAIWNRCYYGGTCT